MVIDGGGGGGGGGRYPAALIAAGYVGGSVRLWLPDTGLHGFASVAVAGVEHLPPAAGYERYLLLEASPIFRARKGFSRAKRAASQEEGRKRWAGGRGLHVGGVAVHRFHELCSDGVPKAQAINEIKEGAGAGGGGA